MYMSQVDIFERKLALLAEGRLAEALAETVPGRVSARKGVPGPGGDDGGPKGEDDEPKAEPSLEEQKGALDLSDTIVGFAAPARGRRRRGEAIAGGAEGCAGPTRYPGRVCIYSARSTTPRRSRRWRSRRVRCGRVCVCEHGLRGFQAEGRYGVAEHMFECARDKGLILATQRMTGMPCEGLRSVAFGYAR